LAPEFIADLENQKWCWEYDELETTIGWWQVYPDWALSNTQIPPRRPRYTGKRSRSLWEEQYWTLQVSLL